MMNNARLSVGLSGLAIGERVVPAGARLRRSSADRDAPSARPRASEPDHRPPRRAPHAADHARARRGDARARLRERRGDRPRSPQRGRRRSPAAEELVDLLTPVTKAWCTDMGIEVTSLAIQVHGGMGYIEETGVAQHYRDIRIAAIYEGTNGIQAMDLVGRKLPMRGRGCRRRLPDRARSSSTPTLGDEWPAAVAGVARGDHLDPHPRRRRRRTTPSPRPRRTSACSGSSPAAGSWPAKPSRPARSALDDKLTTARFYLTRAPAAGNGSRSRRSPPARTSCSRSPRPTRLPPLALVPSSGSTRGRPMRPRNANVRLWGRAGQAMSR